MGSISRPHEQSIQRLHRVGTVSKFEARRLSSFNCLMAYKDEYLDFHLGLIKRVINHAHKNMHTVYIVSVLRLPYCPVWSWFSCQYHDYVICLSCDRELDMEKELNCDHPEFLAPRLGTGIPPCP